MTDDSDRPKVWISEAKSLTWDELQRLAEEEEAAEEAEAVEQFGHPGQRLTITIPLSINPLERVDRFEHPLADALGDRAIVHGGGTYSRETENGMSIVEVDIGVTVADLDEALPLLRACLHAQGAPPATAIKAPGDLVYLLGDVPTG